MAENTKERRKWIYPAKNPRPNSEYIISLNHKLAPRELDAVGGVELQLHYIADKLICQAEDYDKYLSYFETKATGYNSFEELGSHIIDDLNNELVPRWIHLKITAEHAHTIHAVSFEERQPNWENPFLLSRFYTI